MSPVKDSKAPVGFTGTRKGMSPRQKEHLKKFLECFVNEFHHGDCVGADEEAHQLAIEVGIPLIIIHPPVQDALRANCETKYVHKRGTQVITLKPQQYLIRNHQIVDVTLGLVAAPETMEEKLRSGTWATVRYARMNKKYVHILPR